MLRIRTSKFISDAFHKANERGRDDFSVLRGSIVVQTKGRVWQNVEWCYECGDEFNPDGHVFQDEETKRVYCEKCAPSA